MATVKKHVSTSGTVTYYIRCYDGYDTNGKQVERSMTWKPSPDMSQKSIEKELQRQIINFEDQVKRGFSFDGSTRFAEYSMRWLEANQPPQLSPKTYERYKALLAAVNQGIGHIKLSKLQSHHLLAFYNNLREPGINRNCTYAVTQRLGQIIAERNLSIIELAKSSNVSSSTISIALKPEGRISLKSAEKIARALNVSIVKIFDIEGGSKGLSEKTILHHHRLISAILSQATRDRLIPFNIADKDYTKAPRVPRKEATYLDDISAARIITLLNNVPIKWKTAMLLLIYSGMRRGELIGLEWKDIDFKNEVVHITRTSQYLSSMGIITKETKNYSSERTIKLPVEAFEILKDYRSWWLYVRSGMGDRWKYQIEIKMSDGKTTVVDNDRLFFKEDDSTPMNPDSLTDWISKFVQRNNLPKFSPHSLRHTNASLLIANGVNIPTVSKRLGHSSVSTTTKIYAHAIQSADAIASDVLSNKLNPIKLDE